MTFARDVNPVRQRREELQMRLVDLARESNCHAAMISMTEGGYVPGVESRARIADALDTTAQSLWPQEYK